MSYVVYGHYGDDGICFYVGIGDKKRPTRFTRRSKFWHNYVKKHCVSGKPGVKVWHQNLTWEQAKEHEIFWISIYGRRDNGTGCLVNLTDGGDGAVNPSEETKQKISQAHKGKTPWNKGKSLSEETRQKLSQAHKGKTPWNKGKPRSEETRQKISQALMGEKHPQYGKPHSEETKQKMSQAKNGNPSQKKPSKK
jgi:hypothetical protein